MQCPACGESLIVLEHDNIELDYCHACQGTWLDAGELDLILGGHQARTQFLSSGSPATNVTEAGRKCPVCKKVMEKVLTVGAEPIMYDRCPRDGLWFDKGELQLVLSQQDHHIVENRHEVMDFLREVFPA